MQHLMIYNLTINQIGDKNAKYTIQQRRFKPD